MCVPTVLGMNDSSSDDCSPRSRSARLQSKKAAEAALDVKEALLFQPADVDPGLRMALLWNCGRGQMQCLRKPLRGTNLCGQHVSPSHGLVRGALPAKKMAEFRRAVLKPAKETKQWYARHLMWAYASEAVPDLEYFG